MEVVWNYLSMTTSTDSSVGRVFARMSQDHDWVWCHVKCLVHDTSVRQHYKSEHWAPCCNQTPLWYDWKIERDDLNQSNKPAIKQHHTFCENYFEGIKLYRRQYWITWQTEYFIGKKSKTGKEHLRFLVCAIPGEHVFCSFFFQRNAPLEAELSKHLRRVHCCLPSPNPRRHFPIHFIKKKAKSWWKFVNSMQCCGILSLHLSTELMSLCQFVDISFFFSFLIFSFVWDLSKLNSDSDQDMLIVQEGKWRVIPYS